MLRVSPSTLGNFFFLDCERMLRFAVTPKDRLEQEGVPAELSQKSIVSETIIERGRVWEETVVRDKLGSKVTTGPGGDNMRFSDRILPYAKVLDMLRNPPSDHYLYQAHLEPPQKFYQRYKISHQDIVFSPCRPDLIYLQNGSGTPHRRLCLTDIKASHSTKFSHRLQTALYALILRDIVATEEVAHCDVNLDSCDIWLLDEERPETWEMARVVAPLENFLGERLPQILLQPAQAARWSLSPVCEWCGYLEHCRAQAEATQDISLLPYLAKEAKFFLAALPEPVRTLPELLRFLARPDAETICRNCGALAGGIERLKSDVKAMLSREKNDKGLWRGGSPVVYGGPSLALPKGQHVGIAITLQQDPVTRHIFAAGIHVQGGRELHGEDKPWVVVAERPEVAEYRKVTAAFIAKLEQIMRAVHEYNTKQEDWGAQKSLQCYVYDRYERDLLNDLLNEALSLPDEAARALSLFCYFASDHLAESSWHGSNEIPFPILVVTEAIAALLALPVPVTYKLSTVSVALKPEKYASFYSAKGDYSFPFSNRLRTDPLLEAWKSGNASEMDRAITDVQYELEKRLKATFSVLAGIRERVGDNLVAYPPKFFLPAKSDLHHPLLSQLAFMTRYEEVLTYLAIHTTRGAARNRLLETGNALRVELEQEVKPGVWAAKLCAESEHIMPEASGYLDWLLTSDDEAGARAQLCFADYWYREQRWVPKKCAVSFVAIEEMFAKGEERHVLLRTVSGSSSPQLAVGQNCLIYERYSDFTSRRILTTLHELDQQGENLFVSLISEPHQAWQKRRRPKKIKTAKTLENFLAAFAFTPSQKAAFLRVVDGSFQILWGPPGTGKTHFLCLMALAFAALSEGEGKNCKILVTAFTHAAIENCLRMLDRLAQSHNVLTQPLHLAKLGGWRGVEPPERVAGVETWQEEECHQVVGGTIFAIAKSDCLAPAQQFDLVVIDEGSQLKVAEAAIPIARVETKNGRLVIAGDDKQLGPIIHGTYPEDKAGEPYLFASIFDCLHRPDSVQNAYTSQLCECFRMNDTLCRFPAATLYGKEYLPANAEIADRRLVLSAATAALPQSLAAEYTPAFVAAPEPPAVAPVAAPKVRIVEPPRPRKVRILDSTEPQQAKAPQQEQQTLPQDWLSWVLAPEYPLVMLVLQNFFALAENPLEATLVADMTIALRERMQQGGSSYADDTGFWQKGLFIVSPHHVQIQAIHQLLHKRRHWQYPPFVETVNKMQGQESECVIVSYGVSDMNYALREGEFIYSLERLNVALTRARSKAIVCLPYPLLHPPLCAFARQELLAGLDFMLQLRDFVWQGGEKAAFTLPWQGEKVTLLAGRRKL
jgi:hypothetical protein